MIFLKQETSIDSSVEEKRLEEKGIMKWGFIDFAILQLKQLNPRQ